MSTEESSESKIIQQLKKHQDLSYAIVGGATAAIVTGVLWAIITVSTGYQIGYMAIGVGFAVGMAVRFFGAGIDMAYQIVGAVLALAGCLIGNLLSQVGFIAHAESLSYFETLTYLSIDLILRIYGESFNPIDLLFYGIAVYEGYRFSIRPLTDEMLAEFNTSGKISPQPHNNLRFPIVLGSFIAIGVFAFFLSKGTSGHKVFTYESGAKMSEGELVSSKEDGEWLYWSEAGVLQSKGHYINGVAEGDWEWYNDEGAMTRKGSYKNGLFDGVWMNYYPTGVVMDSGSYVQGRMEGFWIARYENNVISQSGVYQRDRQHGEWSYFHDNGGLSSKGSYEKGIPVKQWKQWFANGQAMGEIEWISESDNKILNTWDEKGKPIIVNGNGKLIVHDDLGNIQQTGEIKDGLRVGKWITYFPEGNKQEEGEYKASVYYVTNTWASDGSARVVNGSGDYSSFKSNGMTEETGKIQNGLREGQWLLTKLETGDTVQILNYRNGKLDGLHMTFFENGSLYSEGNFVDNKQEGEWKWYFESGMLESSVVYKNNKKEGIQTFWSESGKKSKEEHYKNNELIGENLVEGEE